MKNGISVKCDIGGRELTIETGALAMQAAGAATIQHGDTILFSAVTCTKAPREGIDYFPLQVEYREKFYAAGRFPGGFFKREARPGEKEILSARITDRPVRPLFPKTYRNDVQINNMLLSTDGENDPDMLSIVVSSTVLMISEIPFLGPIAGVRVGRVDGQFIANPTNTQRETSDIDLVYACTADLPLMIEGGGREFPEADLVAAMRFAHEECMKLIEMQFELRRKLGLPDKVIEQPQPDEMLLNAARDKVGAELSDALQIAAKVERETTVGEIKTRLGEELTADFPEITKEELRATFEDLEIETVRRNVLEHGRRIDGRPFDALRPLGIEVGVLPRTHGSAVFSRGETQALATVTLGTKSDTQSLDAVAGGPQRKTFMLHYNFPPYSVGECGRLGFTGRREIGHGALAERSLREVVPADYPYTIRLVCDIMGSNGSSSMASICAGALALMDAGVPITAPVAGISIGLFSEGDKAVLVTDILGAEDHCGDMDFKVAGTRKGITGFQVDLKIPGLRWELVEAALEQARKARMEILDAMAEVITEPRDHMSPYAPRIETIQIPVDKIGGLIGPGGKMIRHITDLSGAQIDIEDDGTVSVFATTEESMKIAVNEINMIMAEVEEGELYHGTVVAVKDFGCFVEVLPGKEGLVHISQLAEGRVNEVGDVCKPGDRMWVKCIGIDERGRVKLSRREALQEMDA